MKDRDGTAFLGLRINRNIMECKASQYPRPSRHCKFVLIETLWNVKEEDLDRKEKTDLVLIETLWNVK